MNSHDTHTKPMKIKLVRSGIGFPKKQKQVIRGLGFRRLNQVVVCPDTPQIRGMVFKIRHLVEVLND
jgi:large subunit ribosomal protein L30